MPKLPEAQVEERQSELPRPEAAMRHVGGGDGLTAHCRGGLQGAVLTALSNTSKDALELRMPIVFDSGNILQATLQASTEGCYIAVVESVLKRRGQV